MDTLFRDIRYGFRSLLKRPGFTAIALVALALGIGANTAIFSLVNAVVLQPLPYPEPERLVWVWGNFPGGNRASVSPADYLDFRSQNKSFEQFAATVSITSTTTLTGSGEPEPLNASVVTGNYFQALGVTPALGRGFSLDNEKPGNDQVAIISYELWQRRFAGNPGIVNQRINLDSKSFEVIGVMPKNLTFPQTADLWVPLNFDGNPELRVRKAHFLRPLGRLKPGVTMAQAQSDTDGIATQLEKQYPNSNTGWSLRLEGLRDRLIGSSKTSLFILFGAVGFVLLIACANVANLLLVRAAGRQKEIALRTALGASRFRIVRQLMTESLLLAIIGGTIGALIAAWGIDLLVLLSGNTIPPTATVRIDATVLAFTLVTTVITGLLFGLAPALRTMKLNLSDTLKEGGRSGGEGTLKNRTRSLLVVFESALAVVLLIGAGLLIRSFIALQNTNPGFDANNVLTMRVDLPRGKYDTPEKASSFFQQLEQRLSGLPGVEKVGFITELPLTGQPNDAPFTVEGRPAVARGQEFGADFRRVNQNYFEALRIPLLRGRNFTPQEVRDNARMIVVSESLVNTVFPNEEALGKRLMTVLSDKPFEIIGVVGDIRHRSLEFQPYATMYLPTFTSGRMNLTLRIQGDPMSLVPAVRKEVNGIDPEQPVAAIRTMDEWVNRSTATPRYRTTLLGLFAAIAMILAATGIYGVMSYSVAQRTHEIGIRMALGARQGDVRRMVVGQGMLLVAVGLGIGLLTAFGVTRVMNTLLFQVTAKDPLTFLAVAGLLSIVAFVACFIPARRATKVDPLTALRYE
ncbi:MAG TPA: ABC transporter permease [Pyrinomonadaceae bacterium]|nr:ABC transporter permease [Pyrinomonadaceae bacterium]